MQQHIVMQDCTYQDGQTYVLLTSIQTRIIFRMGNDASGGKPQIILVSRLSLCTLEDGKLN